MTNKNPSGFGPPGSVGPQIGPGVYPKTAQPTSGFEVPKILPDEDHDMADERGRRQNLLGKVAGLLQRSLLRSREGSSTDVGSGAGSGTGSGASSRHGSRRFLRPSSTVPLPPRETRQIFLEYDPLTKRRVLNTYEILNDIGKGEHGKVKLARDLEHNELVAIKIVNRHSRDRPLLRMRLLGPPSGQGEYSTKIKREIAILKRCNHKHIVRLREVLDDMNSKKIYLVLEYLEKGEIRWKRLGSPSPGDGDEIPCCGSRPSSGDDDLLSATFSPNLTFRQCRRIFRDVLLGLEYLHMLGIIHRDVKPANLLVSSDNVVKISDFGVSYALFLLGSDSAANELELAKTAGTPAFFAPELCQTNFLAPQLASVSASSLDKLSESTKVLRIDHKIDIWALGVTLYCLLFGRVPFNADSEYELFLVIVNQPVEYPADRTAFNPREEVSELEFDLAKDLLRRMLDKNKDTRVDIPAIKLHPFVLMDLAEDTELLNEFFYLNADSDPNSPDRFASCLERPLDILEHDVDNAVVGLAAHIRRSVAAAVRAGSNGGELMTRTESSSDESGPSQLQSRFGSRHGLVLGLRRGSNDHSVILLELLQTDYAGFGHGLSTPMGRTTSNAEYTPHIPSGLANEVNDEAEGMGERDGKETESKKENGRFDNENLNHSHLNGFIPSKSSSISATMTSTANHSSSGNQSVHPGLNVNQSFNQGLAAPTLVSVNLPRDSVHHILDSQGRSRADSATGSEAAQIETKRNAVGDVYLTNQTALDAFKDIQLQDDRRRRSSAYLTTSRPSSRQGSMVARTNTKAPVASPIQVPSLQRPMNNFLNVDVFGERDPSSVISLPLSDSLASLDSLNDEYLTRKYRDYAQNGRRQSVSGRHADQGFLDSDIHQSDFAGINEKFLRFNLNSQMAVPGRLAVGDGHDDAIAPKTVFNSDANTLPTQLVHDALGRRNGKRYATEFSSCESSCSSSGSSSGSDSDEDGDLTLAFTSKVAPSVRPPFLTLQSRAKSHDSKLRNYGLSGTLQSPVLLHSDFPELEDLPVGLMSNVPRPSVSGAGQLMMPTVSVISHAGGMSIDPTKELTGVLLAPEAGSTSKAESPIAVAATAAPRENIFHNQFNNHYKKDPVSYPFPNAVHYENDRESESKTATKKHGLLRPNNYRSNSVAVGLLQHQHTKPALE